MTLDFDYITTCFYITPTGVIFLLVPRKQHFKSSAPHSLIRPEYPLNRNRTKSPQLGMPNRASSFDPQREEIVVLHLLYMPNML